LNQGEQSLRILASSVNQYFVYVPAAIGIALKAGGISALYERRACQRLSLLLVAITMCAHVLTDAPFTKGAYSLAVFVAMLQPLPAAVVNTLRPIATYSYPIYILHYLISSLVAYKIFDRAQLQPTPAYILLGSFVVFGLSLLAAVSLRRLFPWDWFLPLIFTDRRRTTVASEPQANMLTPDPVKQVN
jgi:hypothetical protein